ncbi:hypothetical protein V1506DRAFT_506013 [Lipomyces tetrasporus]
MTPFFANYGYHPTYHFDIPAGAATMTAGNDRLEELAALHAECAVAWTWRSRNTHDTSIAIIRSITSRLVIKCGYLDGESVRKVRRSYLGPFTVNERIGKTSYRLDLPTTMTSSISRY